MEAWSFTQDRISSNCLAVPIEVLPIFMEVESMDKEVEYHYEKQQAECRTGDILNNTNGSSYRVMEK